MKDACTTVEHSSERDKQFNVADPLPKKPDTHRDSIRCSAMKEYPPMCCHSIRKVIAARYLIDQGGRAKFMQFLTDGMKDDDWSTALNKQYGVANLKALQNEWLAWVERRQPGSRCDVGVAQKKQKRQRWAGLRAQSDESTENREQHCKRMPRKFIE